MPIYEFVCEACGRLVERLQKISDPPPDACPECGGRMAKIMSRTSFQLKGGGWYKDLYSSSTGTGNGGGSASSDTQSSGTDAAKPKADAAPAAAPAASPAPSAPAAAPAAPKKE